MAAELVMYSGVTELIKFIGKKYAKTPQELEKIEQDVTNRIFELGVPLDDALSELSQKLDKFPYIDQVNASFEVALTKALETGGKGNAFMFVTLSVTGKVEKANIHKIEFVLRKK